MEGIWVGSDFETPGGSFILVFGCLCEGPEDPNGLKASHPAMPPKETAGWLSRVSDPQQFYARKAMCLWSLA